MKYSLKKTVLGILCVAGLHVVVLYKIAVIASNQWTIPILIYVMISGVFLVSRFLLALLYQDGTEPAEKSVDALRHYPTASFIIPVKNEENSIYRTIMTCLASQYPGTMECIAIDDRSTDGTYAEMVRAKSEARAAGKTIRIIRIKGDDGGKREAMARGILVAQGEMLVMVDSDTFVKPDGIKILAEQFMNDPRVGAVSGNTQVENRTANILTRMQAARYGIAFDLFKASESVFGTVTCCPGCFSAYRREATLPVLDAWRNKIFLGNRATFGDDRSLTNYILKDWRVVYSRSALATTIVPEDYKTFFRQQLRWKKSWVQEGIHAATFMWRKHPIAAASFYVQLIMPLLAPVVVLYAAVIQPILGAFLPLSFVGGVIAMGILFGMFSDWLADNKQWWYVAPFTVIYLFVLIWQMPYALFKIKDTRWGTR